MTPEAKRLNKLCYINRQPTLWRHGIAAVEIVPADDDELIIGLSPLMLAAYNADHDGDELAIYIINDQDALKEMEEKAYIKNTFRYDSNNEFLSTVRHEALYASYILTETIIPNMKHKDGILKLDNLQDLPESFEMWNDNLTQPVEFNGYHYCYGVCLLNKWLTFDDIYINKTIDKKQSNSLSEILYTFNPDKFYDNITEFSKKLFFFISSTDHNPTIDVFEMANVVDGINSKLFKQLPHKNSYLGYYLNEALVDRCISNMDKTSNLYRLYKSGSRMGKQQLSRSCINIGYVADANNIVVSEPICTNLMIGLNKSDYFKASPGTRKGIIDKSSMTPLSGYLERTLTMALGIVEIIEDDCETNECLEILVFSEKFAESIVGKYYKLPDTIMEWTILDLAAAKSFINQKILIRSPMTCQSKHFKICQKCFGNRTFPSKYVGVMSGQILAERLTQLIMRSFHSSGSANLPINNDIKEFIQEHLINITHDELNNEYVIEFNTKNIPESMNEITGFNKTIDNKSYFKYHSETVKNIDAIEVMNNVKQILKTDYRIKRHPVTYFEDIMKQLLTVGTPYSSFVEILLCNMFLVNKDLDNKKFFRYYPSEAAVVKFGDKNLARNLSPTLGCLYQPNKTTLQKIDTFQNLTLNSQKLSIHEKLWMGQYE